MILRLKTITISCIVVTLQLLSCNPYLTRKLDPQDLKSLSDSVFVAYPVIETRLQITKEIYDRDPETEIAAKDCAKKAVRDLLQGKRNVRFSSRYNEPKTPDYEKHQPLKSLLDSALKKFLSKKYEKFPIPGQDLGVRDKLVIVPYLIWTRTTEEYDKGKCGKVGYRDYVNNKYCTWTRSQTMVFVLDQEKKELVYFRYSQWDIETRYFPYDYRVTKNFKHCFQPLLRDLKFRF